MSRFREGRLRFFNHDPSGPHDVRPIIDHVVVTTATLIQGTVQITGVAGQLFQLVATGYDASGNPINGVSALWTVDNPVVASVSSTGLVTMLQSGTATVTALVDARAYPTTASVSVTAPVDWTKIKVIIVGDSFATGTGASSPSVTGYAARMGRAVVALGGTAHAFGYSGQTAFFAASQFATDLAPVLDMSRINVVPIQFGSNDLVNAGGGATLGDAYLDGLAQLIGLLIAKRALGYTIVIGLFTPPDCNSINASNNNYRGALPMAQSFIRENYQAMGADFLVDVAAFYRIGASGAADQTTAPIGLFGADKVHPNDGGHFLYYLRGLGAIYEYFGLTLPTGVAATSLVSCFEPGICAKGHGTYRPALMAPQTFSTDLIQAPGWGWAHWDDGQKNIKLGNLALPFANPAGFSLTQWVYLTSADVAAGRRALTADVTTSAMYWTGFVTGAFQFDAYFANDTSRFDRVVAPSALAAGIHTVGVTYDPTKARGTRFTLYVDGVKIPGPTTQQNGADGLVTRPLGSGIADAMIGDNLFQASAPLDNHQALSFMAANGVLTDAQMLAQHQYLVGRWLPSVA